jgi:RNA polymerase-interacting CarD/CdnL/TRCF family regulator
MDFFNTKSLKNEKRHMKKLDNMIISELLEIESIYETKIENFLKENN